MSKRRPSTASLHIVKGPELSRSAARVEGRLRTYADLRAFFEPWRRVADRIWDERLPVG